MMPRREPRTRQVISGRAQALWAGGGAKGGAVGHSERRGLLCTWAAWAIVTLALRDLSLTGMGPPQERWAFVLPERALLPWRDTVEVEATTREAQVEGPGGRIQEACRPR